MTTLLQYLETLNSSETQWCVWVSPEDINQFRIGQVLFENGGIKDSWVCIGSLDSLSFGDQSKYEVFEDVIENIMTPHKYNLEALREAYFDGRVHQTLTSQINLVIQAHTLVSTHEAASHFINEELPEIIAEELASR